MKIFSCLILLFLLLSCRNTRAEEPIREAADVKVKETVPIDWKRNSISIKDIAYFQDDYTRDDLLLIMSIGEGRWAVSEEEFSKFSEYTFEELYDIFDIPRAVTVADSFLKENYIGLHNNRKYFYSIEFVTVNNKIYGEEKNIARNDWVAVLQFDSYTDTVHFPMKQYVDELVFMLPDYRIIVSSNNWEGIDFKQVKELEELASVGTDYLYSNILLDFNYQDKDEVIKEKKALYELIKNKYPDSVLAKEFFYRYSLVDKLYLYWMLRDNNFHEIDKLYDALLQRKDARMALWIDLTHDIRPGRTIGELIHHTF
ncbi:hypothetical protein FACS189462_0640 [Spirochaetia bacterium]|nr:hypothetical protein FACS189462_0640 [Spirochaetia bacterium]